MVERNHHDVGDPRTYRGALRQAIIQETHGQSFSQFFFARLVFHNQGKRINEIESPKHKIEVRAREESMKIKLDCPVVFKCYNFLLASFRVRSVTFPTKLMTLDCINKTTIRNIGISRVVIGCNHETVQKNPQLSQSQLQTIIRCINRTEPAGLFRNAKVLIMSSQIAVLVV